MCLNCELAPVDRLAGLMTDPEPAAETRRPSVNVSEAALLLLEHNAARLNPWPTCPECRMLFHPDDAGVVLRTVCDTCESRRLEDLVHDLLKARGRKAAKRALKRLRKLAK